MSGNYFTNERLSQRNLAFLVNFDEKTEKVSRDYFSVELRKKARFEGYEKKRANGLADFCEVPSEILNELPGEMCGLGDKVRSYIRILERYKDDISVKVYCVNALHKLCKGAKEAGILIGFNIVDLVLECISIGNLALSLQCTTLLINLASGNHKSCEVLMDKKVMETCLGLIRLNHKVISENCLWCLANLTSGNEQTSKYLLGLNFYQEIFQLLNAKIHENITWGVWILTHIGKYETNQKNLKFLMSYFVSLLGENNEKNVACLAGILNGNMDLSEMVRENEGAVKKIIQLANGTSRETVIRAVKVLGNIAYTSDENTQILLDNGVLNCANLQIKSFDSEIKKEAYFMLSNVLAGTYQQFRLVLAHGQLMQNALEGLIDASFQVRLEAWHCFSIVSKHTNEENIINELLIYMSKIVSKESDPSILKPILASFENILEKTQDLLKTKKFIEETNCLDEIGRKKTHGNSEISTLVEEIINKYYNFEELHGINTDEDYCFS